METSTTNIERELQIEEGRKEGIMCSLKLEVKGITKIRAFVRVVAQVISVMPLTAGFVQCKNLSEISSNDRQILTCEFFKVQHQNC
jgi:hypothetical protein